MTTPNPAALVALLEQLKLEEWAAIACGDDAPSCPRCGGLQREGHAANCALASALRLAETPVAGEAKDASAQAANIVGRICNNYRTVGEVLNNHEAKDRLIAAIADAISPRPASPLLVEAAKELLALAELRTTPNEHVPGIGNACANLRAALAAQGGA